MGINRAIQAEVTQVFADTLQRELLLCGAGGSDRLASRHMCGDTLQ